MNILIAEDDVTARIYLQRLLARYGECDVVVDGFEALEAFLISYKDKKPYGLVCLDVMMPRVDGMKVLKAIREMESNRGILPDKRTKVIMTTALTGTDYVKGAFEIGCNAFLSKPIKSEELFRVAEQLGIVEAAESK